MPVSSLQAVEGDDWSAVIDRQTEEVAASHSADLADAATPQSQSSEGGSARGATQPPPPIASPFTQAAVHRQVRPRGGRTEGSDHTVSWPRDLKRKRCVKAWCTQLVLSPTSTGHSFVSI